MTLAEWISACGGTELCILGSGGLKHRPIALCGEYFTAHVKKNHRYSGALSSRVTQLLFMSYSVLDRKILVHNWVNTF